MSWYKKSSTFGADPFGAGQLTDKVRTDPYGAMGGASHSGILEPSSGDHHANDYFSEGDHTPTLEKRLRDKKLKREQKSAMTVFNLKYSKLSQ